ncbi:MAG TPA: hypothetical protein VJV75_11575 [Candidatus Polarisedimenticolia bacterium]|nr:hypothetical protein [Candidatus Polarisedimenticolia bacterium]
MALRIRWPFVLTLFALAAIPAHLNFLRREHLHTNEFFHYYVGTKYFPEVGYAGLYDAAVVADLEDDPAGHTALQGIRSLTTYAIVPRQSVWDRRDAIAARFTPARWAAFKQDIAFFREADGPLWTMGESLRDHGYNGTPLVTAILGGLARQPALAPAAFIHLAAWWDILLIIVAAALVERALGATTGVLFLFLWFVNPLNDYGYTGGAYLRSLHVLALVGAFTAFARGRRTLSGVGFGVATVLRIFPVLFLAGFLMQTVLAPARRRLWTERAPLFAVAAATAVVLVAATAILPFAGGGAAWVEFGAKMALHRERLSPNVVGLADLFFYDRTHSVAEVMRLNAAGRRVDWSAEAEKSLASRRLPYTATVLAALALLGLALRSGSDSDGWTAGLVLIYLLLHLAHYDYAILALAPLMLRPPQPKLILALLLLFVSVGLVRLAPAAIESLDARYAAISVLVGLYLASILWMRRPRVALPPPPGRSRRG